MVEADVGRQCDELADAIGWTVERYEQGRATHICEGLPDRRYVYRPRGLRVWVELKKPTGKLTSAQYAWICSELDAGAFAVCVDDVQQFRRVVEAVRRDMGRPEASRICREITDGIWARGPRDGVKRRVARARK